MYNIKQLTNNDLQDFETVTIDGTQYAVVPASFLGDGIIKLGFCLAKRSDFGTSFFITMGDEGEKKIRVGKTGVYELNADSYYDKNHKIHTINPIVTELKLPKFKNFILDYVTNGIEIKSKVSIPTLVESSFTYTGSDIMPELSEYDPQIISISGDRIGKNAKKYNIILTLKDGYSWTDGTDKPKRIQWEIKKQIVSIPTAQPLTYTGYELNPTWDNFNSNQLEIMGTQAAIDAGTYTVIFNTKPNYQWEDGTYGQKKVHWKIDEEKLEIPSQSSINAYTGEFLQPILDNFDEDKFIIKGDYQAKNAGNYIIKLTPKINYQWIDNTIEEKNIGWKIDKAVLLSPIQSNILTYNKNIQYPTWENYNSTFMNIEINGRTNAGEYQAIFTILNNNYCWENETNEIEVQWKINKKKIEYPYLTKDTFTYDSQPHFPESIYSEEELQIIYMPEEAINASSYYYIFELNNNYCWMDESLNNYNLYWTIQRQPIPNNNLPQQSSPLFYNTENQTPVWSEYNTDLIELESTPSAINAGEYYAYFQLKDSNYCWEDQTYGTKYVTWTIQKQTINIEISENTLSFDENNKTKIINISPNANYVISSNNNIVASATIDNNIITVTSKGGGEATLTISINDNNYQAEEDVTIQVTSSLPEINIIPKSFSEATDEELFNLIDAADQGLIDLEKDCGWKIGDERQANVSYMASHNSSGFSSMNAQTITLVLADNYNSNYTVINPKYENSSYHYIITMKNCFSNTFPFGGYKSQSEWEYSKIRDWSNVRVLNALPEKIANCIKKVKVKTYSHNNSKINETQDFFFLPTLKEVTGSTGISPSSESILTQWQYYKTTNNREKDREYWTRSLYYNDSSSYTNVTVTTNGSGDYWEYNDYYGIALAFCI